MNYANTVNWRFTMLNIKEISGLSALSSLGNSVSGYLPPGQDTKASAGFLLVLAAFQLYHFVQKKS